MMNFQTWYLHRILTEANNVIAQVNQFLYEKRFFKEEEGPTLEIPGRQSSRKILPSIEPETSGKKSKKQVMEILPNLEYLYKRNDGQPGAKWFIEEERRKNADPKFNAEKAGLRRCLVVAFKEEEKKQRDGIRFPPGVLVNKINHRIFNYDVIQDKITELIEKEELDCCDAVDIRLALKDKLFKLGESILNILDFPLKLSDNVTVSKEELKRTLNKFYRRDIDELHTERNKQNCGDCGGFRSSMRWNKPAQQFQQRNAGSNRKPFNRNQGRRY